MQNVRRIYDELIAGKFHSLASEKLRIHLVYRFESGKDISRRNLGDGNHIVYLNHPQMLDGDEKYVRGALVTQLSEIALEEKVPEANAEFTRAERLAAELGYREDIQYFHQHEHAHAH